MPNEVSTSDHSSSAPIEADPGRAGGTRVRPGNFEHALANLGPLLGREHAADDSPRELA